MVKGFLFNNYIHAKMNKRKKEINFFYKCDGTIDQNERQKLKLNYKKKTILIVYRRMVKKRVSLILSHPKQQQQTKTEQKRLLNHRFIYFLN